MEPKKLYIQFIVPVYNDQLVITLAIKYNWIIYLNYVQNIENQVLWLGFQ